MVFTSSIKINQKQSYPYSLKNESQTIAWALANHKAMPYSMVGAYDDEMYYHKMHGLAILADMMQGVSNHRLNHLIVCKSAPMIDKSMYPIMKSANDLLLEYLTGEKLIKDNKLLYSGDKNPRPLFVKGIKKQIKDPTTQTLYLYSLDMGLTYLRFNKQYPKAWGLIFLKSILSSLKASWLYDITGAKNDTQKFYDLTIFFRALTYVGDKCLHQSKHASKPYIQFLKDIPLARL